MNKLSTTTVFIAGLMASGAAFAQAPAAPAAPAAPPAAAAAPAGPPKAAVAPSTDFKPLPVKDAGFANPESIRYDLYFDRYLVANSNGANPGFISSLTTDGKVDKAKLIEGGKDGVTLDDPRGMFLRNGVLYVADNKTVRTFDLVTGKSTGNFAVPDAVSLNSLTVTVDGTIFVTDSGSATAPGSIYKVSSDGKTVKKIATGAALKRPTGIDLNPSSLQTGAQQTAAFGATATVAGGGAIVYVSLDGTDVVTIDAEGKELRRVTLTGSSKLTGVSYTDNGYILASSDGGVIYMVNGNNNVSKVAEGYPGTGTIGWDSTHNRILLPQSGAGQVTLITGPKIPGYPNN